MRRIDTRGFSLHHALLGLAVVMLIVAAGFYVYHRSEHSYSAYYYGSSSGSFQINGNQIVAPDGKQFVPYGVVVECAALKLPINQLCTGNDPTGNSASATLNAASEDWKMNIIRFQVAQESLFSGPNGSVNQSYLSLIDNLVKQANSLGMIAIITLQEEEFSGPDFPTASAVTFWRFTASNFKNHPYLFFDLYNEPRLGTSVAGSNNSLWNIWRNGGQAGGVSYVGMQTLVNVIRSAGANNIIIAEGPNHGASNTIGSGALIKSFYIANSVQLGNYTK